MSVMITGEKNVETGHTNVIKKLKLKSSRNDDEPKNV